MGRIRTWSRLASQTNCTKSTTYGKLNLLLLSSTSCQNIFGSLWIINHQWAWVGHSKNDCTPLVSNLHAFSNCCSPQWLFHNTFVYPILFPLSNTHSWVINHFPWPCLFRTTTVCTHACYSGTKRKVLWRIYPQYTNVLCVTQGAWLCINLS